MIERLSQESIEGFCSQFKSDYIKKWLQKLINNINILDNVVSVVTIYYKKYI